jgi:hypothetical protein
MPAHFPERIVCLTEETTETLYLLGEERRIVGISGYTVRPPRARREKPRVSAFLSAKNEKILELKPDLVLGFSDLQADILRDLAKAGLNVLIFNQRSVQEILNFIQLLSSLVGVPQKGGLVASLKKSAAARPPPGGQSLFRGMGPADDQRHPLGERAGHDCRRRGYLFSAFTFPCGHRPRDRGSRGSGRETARHHPGLVVRQEVPARARCRARGLA